MGNLQHLRVDLLFYLCKSSGATYHKLVKRPIFGNNVLGEKKDERKAEGRKEGKKDHVTTK